MKYPKTNYSNVFCDLFNLKTESDFSSHINSRQNIPVFLSNPTLSALLKIYAKPSSLPSNIVLGSEDIDMGNCKISGCILNSVIEEVKANSNYLKELKRKILSPMAGPYFSQLNELIVGSYLKSLGYKIKFNSSREIGKPDIEVISPQQFAIDVKMFPNDLFWFEDTVSKVTFPVFECLNTVKNVSILGFISKNSIKAKKEIVSCLKLFLKTGKPQQSETSSVLLNSMYVGNQGVLIFNSKTNSSFRIIPSIPMTEKRLDDLMQKAIKQQASASKEGITWVFFPNEEDASLGRRIMWEVSEIPKKMVELNNGLVLYELKVVKGNIPSQWNIKSGVDCLVDNSKYPKINKGSFDKFISKIVNTPTIFLP
jgi:hypothetical protein